MEHDLRQYITKEYYKLDSDVEQRNFIENLRFLMMSGDSEFTAYYSNLILKKTDFYSVVDILYQLNNLWMLSEFIHQNRQILLNEVSEISGEYGRPDFSIPCNLGKDTMLSRMFQVMKDYTMNESRVAEGSVEYAVNTHKIKVYAASSHNRQDVAQIILQGKWVEKWGFAIGSNVRVECYQNKLVIVKDDK